MVVHFSVEGVSRRSLYEINGEVELAFTLSSAAEVLMAAFVPGSVLGTRRTATHRAENAVDSGRGRLGVLFLGWSASDRISDWHNAPAS